MPTVFAYLSLLLAVLGLALVLLFGLSKIQLI